MEIKSGYIQSAREMIEVIKEIGIVPFSKNAVSGWSIEEMTHPDWWFSSSDELGPWDWKIDAVREGIIYSKFISRRSAFATKELYMHLMNWRRSIPVYQVAVGGDSKMKTIDDRLQKYLSPILLRGIRECETMESAEIREFLEKEVSMETRKLVGGHLEKYLIPRIRKQAVDFLLGFLDMGTWTVVGDISRVYRGAQCEYKGWQRNSFTSPEALFSFLYEYPSKGLLPNCSPEESKEVIINHLERLFPGERARLDRVI